MKDFLRRHGDDALRLLAIGLVTTGLVSCGDGGSSVRTDGAIGVIVNTEGVDFDPDGYLFSVNSGQGQAIGHQATVWVDALEPGDYVVTLTGIEENCSVPADDNPQTAIVVPGDTVDVRFDVTCDLLLPPDGGGGDPKVRAGQRGGSSAIHADSHLPVREITVELSLARKS